MACAFCNIDFRSTNGKRGISFHRFPIDKLLEEEWRQVVRRHRCDPNWTVKPSSKVCSRHFKLEDLFVSNGKVYLVKGAVPITKTESKLTYKVKLKNPPYDDEDSLLRSLVVKGHVGCAQKHSLTFPVPRTMQAPLKDNSREFVVKKPKRTYSKCKSEGQQASYIKSENGHIAMPRTYTSTAKSQPSNLVKPDEVNRTPPTLDTDRAKERISTNSSLQAPPKKLVCKEKRVGAKRKIEEKKECIIKEEPEEDKEDVATCPRMSPEGVKRGEDKKDVATCPKMSPEGIKCGEDKKDVATCPRMSPEGVKRGEDKEDVATCSGICQEGNVFYVPVDAKRLDNRGIVISDNEIRAAQEDCMKITTSIADKVIETEIRNTWGREVVKVVNHYVDSLVNDALEKWQRGHGRDTERTDLFVYKCYVCGWGWWRLDPFREHLKWHERNMDLEVLKVGVEKVTQECNIVARSVSAEGEDEDVDVEGNCWRCLRSYGEHKEMFEQGKPCAGCSTKYFTCTALLEHEARCLEYLVNLSYNHCKVCRTVWSRDRYAEHLVEMHAVRSDLPICDGLPGLRHCKLCGMPYWVFDYHDCPKSNTGFFQKCMFCCRRFQNLACRKLHYHFTKSNVRCRVCPKMLKKQCMELEHMLKHTSTYVLVYKCRCCTESKVFRKIEFLKRHLLAKHDSNYSTITRIKSAAIPLFVPKTLFWDDQKKKFWDKQRKMAVEGDRPATIDYNVDIKLTNVQMNSKDLLKPNNVDFGTLKTGIGPTADYEVNPEPQKRDYIKKEEDIDNKITEEEYSEYSMSQGRVKIEIEFEEERVSSNVVSELLHEELIIKEEQEDEDFDGDSGDGEFIVGG